ncbi:single-stranded DNA-binding protein [Pedobacter metabolipauper]|uniref:Single-stranded DNA-binding protein n=1 Tax=Pedobacter metabolipauper TaxID=425513 RepID=A0A4R6SR96_9SPHI|nr:single-stranded DNA-binding protein [Pedobacter metabolipauper]TDQ07520.1 single-strand binding protein [Pedobacter metabolipauper]
MNNIKNSIRLTGFAGTDPVVIDFSENKKMARLSVAVNEFYKNGAGEAVNQTQWFNLVFWNNKVSLVDNVVKKGTEFTIEGKLSTQIYTDKKGEQRFATEIIVSSLELVIK